MKKSFILSILIVSTYISHAAALSYYELRIYRLADAADEQRVEDFLKNALVPALHRHGIKTVGVFKPVKEDTINTNRIYLLVPYKSFSHYEKIQGELLKDTQYLSAGDDYINATQTDPPYKRIETIILRSFKFMTQPEIPNLSGPRQDRVYELRSYEGPTEKRYLNKVEMFNEGGEIDLFKRLNFNAVFYGEVLSGCSMPNLMYMTTFENKADRETHWNAFRDAPEWKKISTMPYYQGNVSKNTQYLLYPTDYSDF